MNEDYKCPAPAENFDPRNSNERPILPKVKKSKVKKSKVNNIYSLQSGRSWTVCECEDYPCCGH